MTTDLRAQLHAFAQELVSDLPTVELEEIFATGIQVRSLDPETRGRAILAQPRRGLRVAIAALVATLAFVGLFPLLTDGASEAVGSLDPNAIRPFVVGLDNPNDVGFDPSGWLIISEHFGGKVSKVEILPDGAASEAVVIAVPQFNDLERLVVDDNGVVYFSDNDTVFRVAEETAPIRWPQGRFAGGFYNAEGLAIDANGDLYVADSSESGVRITRMKVLDDGSASTASEVVIVPGGVMAGDIAFGLTGELFVLSNLDEVWAVAFTDSGSVASLRLAATVPGEPRALAFDASGTLHVGTSAGTIWSIGPAGEPTVVLTGFDNVEALAFDASGVLYVVEENRVLRVPTR